LILKGKFKHDIPFPGVVQFYPVLTLFKSVRNGRNHQQFFNIMNKGLEVPT